MLYDAFHVHVLVVCLAGDTIVVWGSWEYSIVLTSSSSRRTYVKNIWRRLGSWTLMVENSFMVATVGDQSTIKPFM